MMRGRFRISVALAVALLLGGAATGHAQTDSGRIEGVVTDSTGGVLPGTTVVVTNLGTGVSETVVTDEAGRYTVSGVRAGRYSVKVTLDGFTPAETPDVTLRVGQVARFDYTLKPGGLTEAVEVVAQQPLLERVTSSIGTVIDEQQVRDLPLNGRNFTQLATLTPGVNRGVPGTVVGGGSGGGDAESFRYADTGGAALSVNGLREQFNNYLLDGVDNNESLVGSTMLFPPVEGIQEFRVTTTNAAAEFGRAGGAVINVVTKSGTNSLAGSGFWNYRPAALADTPYFVKKNNGEKPDFNRWQYGASAGGPLVSSKLFYFGEYAGLKSTIPVEPGSFVTVPTQRMRNGDFSELLNPAFTGIGQPIQIYNPATGQPFPGNVIPGGLINQVGQRYLNAFPLPTRSDRYQQNYAVERERDSLYHNGTVRLDYVLDQNANLFGRFGFGVEGFEDAGRIPGYQAGFGAGETNNRSYGTAIGYNRVLSASMINETRIGLNFQRFEFLPVGYGTNQNSTIGIPGPGGVTSNNGISLIGGGNGSWIEYLGDFGQYIVSQRTLQFTNATTWLRGAHTIKFGGTIMRKGLDSDRIRFGKGFYFFSDSAATPGNVPGLGFTGFEVSDMLIGTTSFTATGLPGLRKAQTSWWENSVFVQDDWKVTDRLTLNLGLRYDVFTPYVEADDRLANYDPSTRRIVLPGQDGAPRSTIDTDWNNFGPRAGFAYQVNDRTVLRGAYGVFYAIQRAGIDNELTQSSPFGTVQFRFGGPGANVRLSDPIPAPVAVDPNSPNLPDGSLLIYWPRDSKTPQIQQYSVSVQRELNANTSLMMAYVGTTGDNLLAVLTNAGFSGQVQDRVTTIRNIGSSRYNALQVQARQTAFKGLSYLASYTFSKAVNDNPGPFTGTGFGINQSLAADPNDLGLDEGRADYDRPHYLSLAATYELPWMRDAEGLRGTMLGGWQVNAIATFASGNPFSVYSGDFRARLTGDPDGPETEDEWFNTAAFASSSSRRDGHERNILRAPGISTVDFSFFKNFRLGGAQGLEFRFEVFNLFDKPQFAVPSNSLGNGDFGQITGTRANTERQTQITLRYTF